ncbi:MAG: glycogen debranching enzyme N-terminal domain-containing protein [Myxacorys californica WJT36-NPBG1]|nr:glycogen debranching enzyme N-terminal domain-containing protein [Myxacorys californica WJT36-NPBG1]
MSFLLNPDSSTDLTSSLNTREWLLTNGLGSFASGTLCDARTRSAQGWLVAALDPPNRCTLLLSHLDASLEIAGSVYPLGTNVWRDGNVSPKGYQFLNSFTLAPTPIWQWQTNAWSLSRQLLMPYGLTDNGSSVPQLDHRLLIRYSYSGNSAATLRLRLVIGDRGLNQLHQAASKMQVSQVVGDQEVRLQAQPGGYAGTPWSVRWSRGHYCTDGTWYWNFDYSKAAPDWLHQSSRKGGSSEDLYSPGYLTVQLQPGETITLEAKVGWAEAGVPRLNCDMFDQALQMEQARLQEQFSLSSLGEGASFHQKLLQASDRFLAFRAVAASPTLLEAYPSRHGSCGVAPCANRGRYMLIALPGMTFTSRRFSLARSILTMLSNYCYQGLIPNGFAEIDGKPIYSSIDTSLWWIETLGLYLEASQDWDFLVQQYPVVNQIYKSFTVGTLHNIRVDASDGLLTWSNYSQGELGTYTTALTWMDAMIDHQPVTPRCGKPIEVNALWYSSLCWAREWAERLSQQEQDNLALANQARRYGQQAEQVKESLQRFWNADCGYLFDGIEPDDRCDPAIRPNAVLAVSLRHCAFSPQYSRRVLQVARDRLLTPYGLRSLDPAHPDYIGCYDGTPKSAHQGAVWSWLLGSFFRAWSRFCSDLPLGFDLQPLMAHFENEGCLNAISEAFDGEAPHTPRGSVAMGVSVAELLQSGWIY